MLNIAAICIMIAFALNSLFCRAAVGNGSIDAMSYAMWRSTAAFLAIAGPMFLMKFRPAGTRVQPNTTSSYAEPSEVGRSRLWRALAWLGYSLSFSWAYTRLDTGLGALVLFGVTQFTMILLGGKRGEEISLRAWAGVLLATTGLVIVTLRNGIGGFAAGPFIAMVVAGLSWGGYSLLARGTTKPASAICDAFLWSLPVLLLVCGVSTFFGTTYQSTKGIALACASGIITTAGGYWAWYCVMAKWEATTSDAALKGGVWQLSVPVIAAVLGILFLQEPNTIQLWVGIAAVIAGIAVAITANKSATPSG